MDSLVTFGLFTAMDPDDIPKILSRAAQLYRSTAAQNLRYRLAWNTAADEVDNFARELSEKIKEAKIKEPRAKPERIRL